MNFFPLDFLNVMNCKNRNGIMLVNLFFTILPPFFKNRFECPFNNIRVAPPWKIG